MKKAVLILLSLILLVFSGCSKNEDVSSSEIVPDAKIENLERAFESASDFSFGAAAVSVIDEERGELFGYISSNGEYIEFLHPEFTSAGDFSKKGLAKVTENKAADLDWYLSKCEILLVTMTVGLYAKMTF